MVPTPEQSRNTKRGFGSERLGLEPFVFWIGFPKLRKLIVEISQKRWLRASAASQYLGLSKSTLAKQRMSGLGPRYSKLGPRLVVYDLTDLDSYLEARKITSTSEAIYHKEN